MKWRRDENGVYHATNGTKLERWETYQGRDRGWIWLATRADGTLQDYHYLRDAKREEGDELSR